MSIKPDTLLIAVAAVVGLLLVSRARPARPAPTSFGTGSPENVFTGSTMGPLAALELQTLSLNGWKGASGW